jgi:23S rRNA pseudouridine955/2504/2580 synthase
VSKVETRTVTADEAEIRLDRWFKRHYPDLTHIHLQKLLRTGQVRVEGKRAEANTRLEPGQTIRIPPIQTAPVAAVSADGEKPAKAAKAILSDKEAEALRARVLYRDDDVLVFDKPAGLAVQGGTGTTKHLDAMLDALTFDAKERPRLVHRLDRDTSGALVLARNVWAAGKLTEMFRGKDIRKIYWAATVGVPKPFQGKIDLALAKHPGSRGERVADQNEPSLRAVTMFNVLEHAGTRAAFVAMWPRTGRTHQLRVHMAAIGTPILGDGKYAGQDAFLAGADLPRQVHLHARRIIVPHPRGKGVIDATAPLPEHMQKTWAYFGFGANRKDDPFDGVE